MKGDTIKMDMGKLRAWPLRDGGWLVLLFLKRPVPGQDDRLELLAEMNAEDEEGIHAIRRDFEERMRQASVDAGFPDVEVRARIAGSVDE